MIAYPLSFGTVQCKETEESSESPDKSFTWLGMLGIIIGSGGGCILGFTIQHFIFDGGLTLFFNTNGIVICGPTESSLYDNGLPYP